MQPLLDIQDLTVHFLQNGQQTPALRNINLTINRGEIVALVGESGSGKSVTSLSVLRLLASPPAMFSGGQILFHDNGQTTDLLKRPEGAMQELRGQKIAMIFQEPMTSLNPVHTCGHQVMEAILQHKTVTREQARTQTLALFEMVKLPDPQRIFKSYPHQISGGQKQRVMIAMAMSCNPSLLICDEPTTALDVTVQKRVLQLIRDLQIEQQMGVLFITHDLGVVSEIADKIVVMYRGSIIESGTREQILRSPEHPYTRALLACRPALYPRGTRLPVVSDFLEGRITHADNSNTIQEILPAPATEQKPSGILSVANPPSHPFLEVKDLHVWFPTKHSLLGKPLAYTKAVNGVSFSLNQGETLGLVGESGCGKSTLGRSLLRLVTPTSGDIVFKGESILHKKGSEANALSKQMQIIFQDPYSSLNPRKRIGEAIAEPLLVHGIGDNAQQRKEMAVTLLEKVGLSNEHYYRYPHEFSGGQRQRIVIARALALRPSFVVCDESVSALDVSVQAQVLNLLNDLKKEFGFTAIFISHDLSVVKYISDRIMIMNKGRIEESGPSEEVYHHPKSSYTQQLIASIPVLHK
ncbi:ABC transporter ATP-binding protein [Filimonas effusa]|uniref:ABC transporter ATP-binding protein n=1 Tax=Filimonas effusa TaxID=2508721 RepID=A0A4Q1DEV0_9BACT|nr:ABC transporter ATP-binding protein [Filimonas effusa]RXK87139.1 ABC transporter ATP-binding protein [Filimonas effusa]